MDSKEDNTQKTKKEEIDLLEVFIKVWQHRKFLIIFTAIVTLLGVTYALVRPPLYEAQVKLYKNEGENATSSRLKGLASQFGFGGALGMSGQLFDIKDLVNSRNIREDVLLKQWETGKYDEPVDLVEYWKIEEDTREEEIYTGLEKLKDLISVSTDEETQLTTINVLMPEARLSADVGNYIVKKIEHYIQKEQKNQTKENLKHIHQRLDSVKAELTQAEEALKQFRKRNRVTALSPELQTRQMRLQRAVTIKQEVYLVLQKELEMTKIELVKETPVINVLDYASKPVIKAKPKRKLIVIISFFAGLFLSLFVLIIHYLRVYIKQEMSKRSINTKLFKSS